jgi:hypothetical protein
MTSTTCRPLQGNEKTVTDSYAGVELGRILAGKTHAPVVYFARVGDNVKIGTTTNLKGRMQSLYLSLEDVLVVIPGGKDVESAYHQQFAESRIQGPGRRELFRRDGQLRLFLDPWRRSSAIPEPEKPLLTLREACADGVLGRGLVAARKASQRPGFPEIAGWDGSSALYKWTELAEWQDERVRVLR